MPKRAGPPVACAVRKALRGWCGSRLGSTRLLNASRRAFARRGGTIGHVEPALLVVIGVAAVVGGVALLLSFGSAFSVARLLQTTRSVTVAEAVELARSAAAAGRPA